MKSVIIGSSRGIGAELTKSLVQQGHEVIGISRSAASPATQHFSLDVQQNDTSDWPVLASVDHVVYCPGSITLKPFRSLKTAQFEADFAINVLGAVRAIQHFLPALKKGTSPSIVLFSTVAVGAGMPFHASIAAAKGGVEALARSLAAEFAPTIRVNAVAPSLTDTDLAGPLLNNEKKQAGANERHPLKRYGQPQDVAKAIQFLMESDWVTGQVLGIDGGLSTLKS